MPIRVIAGSAKGRKLKLVPGDTTRPVMDRVKEAYFNIIGRDIIGARFLDLFAGTGSVGIEALSRGAKQAVFIEKERIACRTIEDNLIITKLKAGAIVHQADVFAFLNSTPAQPPFDFIYIAPPQYKRLWLETLQTFDKNPAWFGDETTVTVQLDPQEWVDMRLSHLQLTDERIYGKTLLVFYMPKERTNKLMNDLKRLEAITQELMELFDIHAPPVPIESMLQNPKAGMWEEVDVNQLSGTFLSIKDQYSPRMSLARLLARHIATSEWGKQRGLLEIIKQNEELLRTFARMIIMPAPMLEGMTASSRNPMTISQEFEAPEEDARQRLFELFG